MKGVVTAAEPIGDQVGQPPLLHVAMIKLMLRQGAGGQIGYVDHEALDGRPDDDQQKQEPLLSERREAGWCRAAHRQAIRACRRLAEGVGSLDWTRSSQILSSPPTTVGTPAVVGHTDSLVFAALFADAAPHVRRSGPMLEVVSAGCHQGDFKRPPTIPHHSWLDPRLDWASNRDLRSLYGITDGHRLVQELLPRLEREPLLRPGFPESRWLLACARRYRRQRRPPVATCPPRGSPQNGSGPLSLLKLSTPLMRLRSNKPGTLLAPACPAAPSCSPPTRFVADDAILGTWFAAAIGRSSAGGGLARTPGATRTVAGPAIDSRDEDQHL
jgi:hypothetical protein